MKESEAHGWKEWEAIGIEFGFIKIMVAIEVIGKEELTKGEYVQTVLKKNKAKTLGNIKDRILKNKRN